MFRLALHHLRCAVLMMCYLLYHVYAAQAFVSEEGDPFTLLNVYDEWVRLAGKAGGQGGARQRVRLFQKVV